MKKILIFISVIIISVSGICIMATTPKPKSVVGLKDQVKKGFVVMELFTSQGCSSCPPADELLGVYAQKNNDRILPLAFHVDYWNRLGWIDSFSSSRFSERQRNYAEKFGLESVYTPQLILDGQKEFTGSDAGNISTGIAELLKEDQAVNIGISDPVITANTVKIHYSLDHLLPGTSMNGALVQARIQTHIKAGENRGADLTNYNVVRDFISAQLVTAAGNMSLKLPAGSIGRGYSIVLFVQDNRSGKIYGAVKVSI
jgi:hypothetical protein